MLDMDTPEPVNLDIWFDPAKVSDVAFSPQALSPEQVTASEPHGIPWPGRYRLDADGWWALTDRPTPTSG
jgi:hypothetical protein